MSWVINRSLSLSLSISSGLSECLSVTWLCCVIVFGLWYSTVEWANGLVFCQPCAAPSFSDGKSISSSADRRSEMTVSVYGCNWCLWLSTLFCAFRCAMIKVVYECVYVCLPVCVWTEGQGSSWWSWMKLTQWHRTHRMLCDEVNQRYYQHSSMTNWITDGAVVKFQISFN